MAPVASRGGRTTVRRAAPEKQIPITLAQFIFPAGMARALAPLGGSVIAPVGICPAAAALLAAFPWAALPPAFLRAFIAMTVTLSRWVFSLTAARTADAIRALARFAFTAMPGAV